MYKLNCFVSFNCTVHCFTVKFLCGPIKVTVWRQNIHYPYPVNIIFKFPFRYCHNATLGGHRFSIALYPLRYFTDRVLGCKSSTFAVTLKYIPK